MKIKVDDCFPDVTFFQLEDGNPKTFKSSQIFNEKKIILVSVPGAFTPTCSNEHLPGYVKLYDEFKKKGIDDIYFVAANDPFVMEAWINSTVEKKKIKYLADSNLELLDATGLEIDLTVAGLGKRLSRFAIFIDNGLIKKIFDEEGGGLEKSSAENLLKNL
jgi:peroxiredoxin